MTNNIFTPKETVAELDRFIIGQDDAKKSVAIALRNRWRRSQLADNLRDEVIPKNILMIGPTGCGKTEIARRLAKLADAPFIKVEATKFTEIGYVGRDVESIIRDLSEISIAQERAKQQAKFTDKAQDLATDKILDILVGVNASEATRNAFRNKLENGDLDEKEVEVEVSVSPSASSMPTMEIPGMPGAQMGMMNLGDLLGGSQKKKKKKKLPVKRALELLIQEEADAFLDEDAIIETAISNVQNNGIVFIDEIDKICVGSEKSRGEVSREGVQRDLLPLLEGTSVTTKHGTIKTDHILFISSGAFHVAKPSDLLPELQGRLPIRVELKPLVKEDFVRILKEPEANLIEQSVALMATEGVTLDFTDNALDELATLTVDINQNIENIGARRLHTLIEKLLEDISFDANNRSGETIKIDKEFVEKELKELSKNQDLSRFIL